MSDDATVKEPQPLEGEYLALADQAKAEQKSNEPEQEQEKPVIPTAELIYPICEFATAIFCPDWEINQAENKQLAQGYADVLDKYFPDSGKLLGVELNALLITAAVFGPRLVAGVPPRKRPKPEPEKTGDKEPEPKKDE